MARIPGLARSAPPDEYVSPEIQKLSPARPPAARRSVPVFMYIKPAAVDEPHCQAVKKGFRASSSNPRGMIFGNCDPS